MSIDSRLFYNCPKLTEIIYDGTTAEWMMIQKKSGWDSEIGDYTVWCTDGIVKKDESVLPYSQNLEFTENKDGTYTLTSGKNCADEQVVIPCFYNGSLVTAIGERAFEGCSSLKKLIISNEIITIGNEVFSACNNLTEITYNGTIEQWNQINKHDGDWNKNSYIETIVCTDGTISKT